ncbi:hypothetical protein [Microbacterium testaceum]|uniref:Uncharacterized protein n=1 Tax=Microbacterium testaceum TaxID=2033 RepID=A0A2T7WYG8_MICTE|nr:hypothetical protein [Microbacterium testaceum]PVE79421.1 hypothetical protein DC432_01320 [Microbacterium testaceum]
MDDGARDELERLRARAYGPDADLADDPVAWDRLRELEEQVRFAAIAPPPAPASVPPAGPVASTDPEIEDDDDVGADEPPRRRRLPVRSRRGVWAWAVSLAAVTALASAATALGVSFVPVAGAAVAPQVGTLTPDPGADIPAVFGQRTGSERAFQDYFGVTAYVALARTDSTDTRNPCLYLLDSGEVGRDDGRAPGGNFVYGGCGAGVFPATVEFVVAEGMPPAFVERFPIGTSVQFVYDGENVGVFSDRG